MHQWNQFNFQDSTSPVMEEFIYFHDYVMLILIYVMSVVGAMMANLYLSPWVLKGLTQGQALECIWTLAPAVILVFISVPSLGILYSLDETVSPSVTMKVSGHQWYWSYEFSEFWESSSVLTFDAYMSPENSEEKNMFRLLDTDCRPSLPFFTPIRALVTSSDVIHSWAVPALGVKLDASPGRLNQMSFTSDRPGVVYGQCSEICGANHSFMPISVEFVEPSDFLSWVSESYN